jgi:hypothetical protein
MIASGLVDRLFTDTDRDLDRMDDIADRAAYFRWRLGAWEEGRGPPSRMDR